jgi:glycosyltransferase involved in cell wall biosynthesis
MLSRKFQSVILKISSKDYNEAGQLLKQIPKSELTGANLKLYNALHDRLLTKIELNLNVIDEIKFDSSKPIFLIVTPCFNSIEFISETIKSVLNQRGDFNVLYHVQDGGSTDGTIDLLHNYERNIKYSNNKHINFSWESSKDKGMYDAINKGYNYLKNIIEIGRYDKIYSTWINSDDLLTNNSLQTVSAFFQENNNFKWLTGIISLINEKGSITHTLDSPKAYSQKMLANGLYDGRYHPSFLAQEGTFWHYDLWESVGGVSNNMRLAGDWDLWRKFANVEALIKIEAVLAYHRRHKGQLSNELKNYYKEIDTNSSTSRYDLSTFEKKSYRALFDTTSGIWNAIDFDTGIDDALPFIRRSNNKVISDNFYWPKISIVTPTYNQGKYIRETIESVLSQGYPNIEFIIIDGASTDDTISIINEYKEYIHYFVSEKDNGQSHAINKGFSQASGEIFTWLNSDDQLAPNALFSMAVAFKTSGADMVAGICEVYEEGKLIHRHMTSCLDGELPLDPILELDTGWNAGQYFYQPEVFFTRNLWEKAGGHVREDCYYSMDYEMWCRFAAVKAKLHVIGKPIVHFRSHPEQKTADPSLFKAELVSVKNDFLKNWNIIQKPINRPSLNWNNNLKVAMVNDIGFKYGAGIAHERIANGFSLAGHEVKDFVLQSYIKENEFEEDRLHSDIESYTPNLIIFGNIHYVIKDSIAIIQHLEKKYPIYWLTHDFWILTGRCAYVQACTKYKVGCDSICPTATEYPELDHSMINSAWTSKRKVLSEAKNLTLLANSNWSKDFVDNELSRFNNDIDVDRVKLGVPSDIFKPVDKKLAKNKLGVTSNNFTVTFSVSALSDQRKGGQFLIDALQQLNVNNLTVILIGHLDYDFPVDNIELITLGYVDNAKLLVQALNAADVFIGPSREETLGQVFLEAAMCGTPSIGFDVTGVKEAIIDGITGITVKEMNSTALKVAINKLYENREYAAELGRLSHIYAMNEFSIESSYRSFFNVFDKSGLIDDLAIPHKITFISNKEESNVLNKGWSGLKGVSIKEGPYPEFNIHHEFYWCYGDNISLLINSPLNTKNILVEYLNPLFDDLKLDINLNDVQNESVTLLKTKSDPLSFNIDIPEGMVVENLKIFPNKFLNPSSTETRALSFQIKNIVYT